MKLLDWFRPKPKFIIVEIPKGFTRPSEENRESVATLQHHIGFQDLMSRLDIQRFALESTLKGNKHTSLEEVYYLQAGIYWLNYLRQYVDKAVFKSSTVEIQPTLTEEAEFTRMRSFIERVSPQD